MKKKVGLAVLLTVVLVLSSLFAFGGVFAKAPDDGGKPLTVLVAGYGWYAGIPEGCVNNAEAVAMALDGEVVKARDFSGTVIAKGKVYGIAVPVVWAEVMPAVQAGIDQFDPDIIIGLGTSGGAKGIRPEPFGSNVMRGCDAIEVPVDCYDGINDPVSLGGDDWVEGNLPYTAMVMAMLEAGIPARLGHQTGYDSEDRPTATPGWYMCNYMTYHFAMMTEADPELIAGFIHIPQRSPYAALFRQLALEDALANPLPPPNDYDTIIRSSIGPSLELQRIIDGVRISIEETLRATVQ